MPIRDFYQVCKNVNNLSVIVTIGMDLLARGISFVSSERVPDAIAATTLIYKPGVSMHAVGLCQTIGRITGIARPDLKRHLFASDEVIKTYNKYNLNQEMYIRELIKNEGTPSSEFMKTYELEHKIKKNLDRPKLNLKPLYKKEENINNEGKMKELINKWWNSNCNTGKILRFVYESEVGVSEHELKEYIKEIGSSNVIEMYNELIRKARFYDLIFTRSENKITKITKKAQDFINLM